MLSEKKNCHSVSAADLEKETLLRTNKNLVDLVETLDKQIEYYCSLLGVPVPPPADAKKAIKERYKKGYGKLLSN